MLNLGSLGNLGEKLGAAGDLAEKMEAAGDLAGKLAGKAPDQLIDALRKLLEQAQKLADAAPGDHKALDACIQKVKDLLNSDKISTEAVTKLTAELTARIKEVSDAVGKKETPAAAREKETASQKSAAAPARTPAAGSKTSAAASKPVDVSDVPADSYCYDAVQWAVGKGIASGTSAITFGANDACTRAQTVTFLWRAAGSPEPKKQDNPFSDVPSDAYYCKAVLWAMEKGITSGLTATTFSPDATVTRAQVATFLYRNAGSPAVSGGTAFTDVADDAFYAKAVAWVSAKKIASGTTATTFSPDAVCTRGQIVTFLYRSK